MLQAEILVQYGMRGKAIERLQRIQELFPHEERQKPGSTEALFVCGNDSTIQILRRCRQLQPRPRKSRPRPQIRLTSAVSPRC